MKSSFRSHGANLLLAALAILSAAMMSVPFGRDVRWTGRCYSELFSGKRFVPQTQDDDLRDLAERNIPSGSSVFLVRSPEPGQFHWDRARRQTLSWIISPEPLGFGSSRDASAADPDYVIAPVERNGALPFFACPDGRSRRFRKQDETSSRVLWRNARLPAPQASPRVRPGSRLLNEGAGLLLPVVLALVGFLWAGMGGTIFLWTFLSAWTVLALTLGIGDIRFIPVLGSAFGLLALHGLRRALSVPWPRFARGPAAVFLLAFLLFSYFALAHRFLAPNGLAVVGGKAKLWALSGRFPNGFFTRVAWRDMEPAYPPGLAALIESCYAISGECGEWLTQCLGALSMAAAMAFLSARSRCSVATFWAFLPFLSPFALRMGAQLYPDACMAACILAGWDRLSGIRHCQRQESDDNRLARKEAWIGCAMLGAAGWFKTEGVVFALAAWLACRLFRTGRAPLPFSAIVAALVLPLSWHGSVRLAGGAFNDYASLWSVSLARVGDCGAAMLDRLFLHSWEYAFAPPLLLLAVLVPFVSRLVFPGARRELVRVAFFFALASAALAWILGCSRAPDWNWHVATSVPRLLWTPTLVVVFEFIRPIRGKTPGCRCDEKKPLAFGGGF